MSRRWPVLAPLAAIAIAYVAWSRGMSDDRFVVIVLAAHLTAPIWAASVAKGSWRAFWRGPAVLIGAHALAVTVSIALVAMDPDSWAWIWILLAWAAAVIAYAIYCAVVFAALVKRFRT